MRSGVRVNKSRLTTEIGKQLSLLLESYREDGDGMSAEVVSRMHEDVMRTLADLLHRTGEYDELIGEDEDTGVHSMPGLPAGVRGVR